MRKTYLLLVFLLAGLQAFSQSVDTDLLMDQYEDAVVSVQNGDSLGMGFLVDMQGHVVTSYHLVKALDSTAVVRFSNQSQFAFSVVAYEMGQDIALLQLKNFTFDSSIHTIVSLMPATLKAETEIAAIEQESGNWEIKKGTILDLIPKYFFTARVNLELVHGVPLFDSYGQVVGMLTSRLPISNPTDLALGLRSSAICKFLQGCQIPYKVTSVESSPEPAPAVVTAVAPVVTTPPTPEVAPAAPEEVATATAPAPEQAETTQPRRVVNKPVKRVETVKRATKKTSMTAAQKIAAQEILFVDSTRILEQEFKEKQLILKDSLKSIKIREKIARLEAKEQRAAYKAAKKARKKRLLDEIAEKKFQLKQLYPARIALRIGGGAQYYMGRFQDLRSGLKLSQLSWCLSADLAYRFGVNRRKDRGTNFGIFARMGKYGVKGLQYVLNSQGQDYKPLGDFNPFYETEVGVLVYEWLRISSGVGWQSLQLSSDEKALPELKRYYVSTVGFVIPLCKHTEIDLNLVGTYGGFYKRYALRAEVALKIRLAMGRW